MLLEIRTQMNYFNCVKEITVPGSIISIVAKTLR